MNYKILNTGRRTSLVCLVAPPTLVEQEIQARNLKRPKAVFAHPDRPDCYVFIYKIKNKGNYKEVFERIGKKALCLRGQSYSDECEKSLAVFE